MPPVGFTRYHRTTSPGTAGRLRSERVDDFVGIGSHLLSSAVVEWFDSGLTRTKGFERRTRRSYAG